MYKVKKSNILTKDSIQCHLSLRISIHAQMENSPSTATFLKY